MADIFLIEDDADILSALKEALEAYGYSVETARNGLEAVSALKHDPLPSLIFLDQRMPVMDGKTFLLHKAEDPRLAPVPTYLFSAAPLPPGDWALTGYLKKPVDLDELLATAEKHLPR